MPTPKRQHPKVKSGLHPRNQHRERYDFKALMASCPDLAPFVRINEYNDESIDFSNAEAVLALNKALLKHYYNISHWDIPDGFLCPPVPGRADYIHYVADLLASSSGGEIPKGAQIQCLDIGVGANCIYPIIGHAEYGWSFVGADVEVAAVQSAEAIVTADDCLSKNVELRLQVNTRDIFPGIWQEGERFDVTICNPPFHASIEEAQAGTLRKLSSLNKKQVTEVALNFGGQHRELYCPGGEERFIKKMITQSKEFSSRCLWFTTLVSKKEHVRPIQIALKKAGVAELKTIPMSQGTKTSRVVAWTFLDHGQQVAWRAQRWLQKQDIK